LIVIGGLDDCENRLRRTNVLSWAKRVAKLA